jgi:hypothetical protein
MDHGGYHLGDSSVARREPCGRALSNTAESMTTPLMNIC